ncbi:MAG: zinc-ribbon domain-containing protein [Rhizobacter sp.]
MTQICSNCQTPNRDSARFCHACGQPLHPGSIADEPPMQPLVVNSGQPPTESATGTVTNTVAAASPEFMWPEQFATVTDKAAPLPPAFGLPPSPSPALNSSAETRGRRTGSSLPSKRPLIALASVGVLVLVVAGLWLGWGSSSLEVPSASSLSAATPPLTAASGSSPGTEILAAPEPRINEMPAALTVAEPSAPQQQLVPSVAQRPAPKAETRAPVAKLSIPALPASAAAPAQSAATTAAAPSPAPETVISNAALSPREACASSKGASLAGCLEQQCAKATLHRHPQCQRLRTEQEQEFQRIYGGS